MSSMKHVKDETCQGLNMSRMKHVKDEACQGQTCQVKHVKVKHVTDQTQNVPSF